MTPMSSPRTRFGALVLASVLALSGCGMGGDGDEAKDESSDSTPSASGSTTTDDGFTAWGSELEIGDTARVPWSPKQKTEGAVEVTVTRVEQVPMKAFDAFKLTKQQRKGAAYYVRAKVENIGEENLSGFTLPVYLDDGSDVIYPPVNIPSAFQPCSERVLPKKFTPGKTTRVFMVFLTNPGEQLRAVALQPAEDVQQIDWTGPVSQPGDQQKGKKHKKQKAKKRSKNG